MKKNYSILIKVLASLIFILNSVVSLAQKTWTGGGGDGLWATATNWSGGTVPISTDQVVIDNSGVAGTFTITLPTTAVAIVRLTITPTNPNIITIVLPTTNTAVPGLLVGDLTASTDDIIINSGGVLKNSSGAASGNGIQADISNGTLRINNGGKFTHNTARSTAGSVPLLSTAVGTETGIYEYDSPGTGSVSISASGRTYGSLVLTRTAGPTGTYIAAGASALTVKGNFIVNTGVTYSTTMTGAFNLAGDFTNSGIITLPSTQAMNFIGTTVQSITNSGTLTFSTAEPVTLNNAAGLVLNNSITINGILTLTAGKITTGNNTLTISNTTAGAIVGADATKYVIATGTTGGLQRSVAATINSYDFPIGSATDYKPATINFTTAPSVAGALTARFKTGYPGFPNAVVLTDGAITNINGASFQGSWFIDASGGLTGGIYTSTFVGNGATDVLDYTKTVLLKRPTAGGDWILDGTLVTTTGSNTQPSLGRTGMSGFSEFGLGGELLVALPISLNYLNGYKQNDNHNLSWKVTCTNNATATMSIERSTTGRNFTTINTITADALRCQQPFDYTDNSPLQGSNYYRLKMTDANGKVTYSAVIVLLNAATGFDIVGLSPSLINSNAILNVTAAQKTKMDVVITDMAGRQVQKITYNLIAGSNQFTINLANLMAGIYQITGYTTEGKSKTIRFTKQ
jgi:hypothetical protein